MFLYWVDKAENDIYNFDFSVADEEETTYLKYVKVLKYFFCEGELLKDIRYDTSRYTAHFYKDNIRTYVDYIRDKDSTISYETFVKKMEEDCSAILPVVDYVRNIRNKNDNYQYNIIRSFHLFLILFLNKYGLDYHYTDKGKFKKLSGYIDKTCIAQILYSK